LRRRAAGNRRRRLQWALVLPVGPAAVLSYKRPLLSSRLTEKLRPPATERLAGGRGEASQRNTKGRTVRTSVHWDESTGEMRSNLLIQQPPTGAPPQHGVSALPSHASSSRSPTPPAARGCSRRQRRPILGKVTVTGNAPPALAIIMPPFSVPLGPLCRE